MRIEAFSFRNRTFSYCVHVKVDVGMVVQGWLASLPAFRVVCSESIGVPIVSMVAFGTLRRL